MSVALGTPGLPGVGAVGPADARLDDAGLIAVHGPTALDTRTGVLIGPGAIALLTPTADSAPMTVAIGAHHWVTSRQASDGVYRGANEQAGRKVTIGAAPGVGLGDRVDVVYEKQGDPQSTISTGHATDVTAVPVYGVLAGTPGGGKPSLSSIPGAIELGTVTVSPGAVSTNGAGVAIVNTARLTSARGTPVPVRSVAERDALTKYPSLQAVFVAGSGVVPAGAVHVCDGLTWHQLFPQVVGVYEAAWAEAPGNFAANPQMLTQHTVADPGVPYRALIHGHVELGTQAVGGATTRWDLGVGYGGSGGTLTLMTGRSLGTNDTITFQQAPGIMTGVLTGALRIAAIAARPYGDKGGYVGVNKRLVATLYAA